jgi:membrane associated rhomboid family serine protease
MLFPIGDENERGHLTPWFTYALIAVNVVVFLITIGKGSEAAIQLFFYRWAVVPIEYRDLMDYRPLAPGPFWITLFSAMFMHGGIAHIAGNMLFLAIFGDNIENALGHIRFLLFYLVCGVVASFAHILFNIDSDVPSLGASGAISGVLGAYLILYPGNRVRVLVVFLIVSVPAFIVLGGWILMQIAAQYAEVGRETAQTDGVAYMAHIGGFAAGVIMILLFRAAGSIRRTRPSYAGWATQRTMQRGIWD